MPCAIAIKESFFIFLWEQGESESQSQELHMLKGTVQRNQCNGMCRFGGQDLAAIVSLLGSAQIQTNEAVLPIN